MKRAALAALVCLLPLAAAAQAPGPDHQHRRANAQETHATGRANAAEHGFFGALQRGLGKWAHEVHGKLKRASPGRCSA